MLDSYVMRTFRPAQPTHRVVLRQAALAVLCLVPLAGCVSDIEHFYDSKLSLDRPVDWWHQLQGGPIANERPPPPGITDPYPNLAQVPAKPVPTDAATRAGLTAQLASQRDQARLLAAQDPVVFPTAGATTAPKPPTPAVIPPAVTSPASPAATSPPVDDDKSTMVLEAASASKPTAAPAPVAAPTTDPAAPAAFRNPPASSGPVVSGPIPPLPTAAPPLPNLPGLPTTQAVPVVARARPSASFQFAAGSAALPQSGDDALRALALRAAGGPIAITAGGDATSNAPAAQGAALPLALRRTGAMSAVLIAAGVPSGTIRTRAVPPGRDASAQLVD